MFDRPTLGALVARIKSDLRSRLSLAGPLVRRAMADVLATVWGGAVHMLHGHLEWISRQILPATADADQLLRAAGMYGISLIPASYATGTFTATGTNGSTIPAGAIVQIDTDITYAVQAPGATIALGVATVAIKSVLAGTAANVDAGAVLTFQSPLTGANATGIVDSGGITGGFDQETIEELRTRFIEHLQEPPAGGANQDYVAWAKSVDGVTRVWVYPNENGLGTAVVRFVLDGQVSIFPTSPEVASVQAAIDAQRPITAAPTAAAPTALSVNFTLHLNPDTTDTRTAVTAELTDLLFRDGAPGDGSTALGTIKLSHIRTAIGDAVDDYTMTVPSADVVPTLGQLAVMGTITWV